MARDTRVAAAAAHKPQEATTAERNTVAFDEQGLADACVAGSARAFEELYTHYFPKVRGYCLRKTSNPQLAEDIAQEAFARAFERIEDFGGPKHFGGWVGTIASNLITDHYRRKRNDDISLEAKYEDPSRGPAYEENPIRNLQRSDTSRLVQLALAKLSERQREALLLHEVKGMTCAAVGEQLGITEVAAESLLARARRRLRKEVTSKATPADLFGIGGLGLLPALLRAWRRAKDSVGRKSTALQAAVGRGIDGISGSTALSLNGAKTLVVVMGAALAVEAASAAAPPVEQVNPVTTTVASQPAAAQDPILSADGDPSDGALVDHGGITADVTGGIDPESRSARVSTDGSVDVPTGDETEGHAGLNYDLNAGFHGPEYGARARVFVQDDTGENIADTGEIQRNGNFLTPAP